MAVQQKQCTNYIVGSFRDPSIVYKVNYDVENEYYSCSCPDFEHRCKHHNMICKHIMKVKDLDDNCASYETMCENNVVCEYDEIFSVKSTSNINVFYEITYFRNQDCYTCSCPDFEYRCKNTSAICKHIANILK